MSRSNRRFTLILALAAACGLCSCRSSGPPTDAWGTEYYQESEEVRQAISATGEAWLPEIADDWELPGAEARLHEVALVLAGMPAGRTNDAFADVRRSGVWREHQRAMNQMWRDYSVRHEMPIRQWAAREMPDLARSSTLFYPFSGPDFLFAQAFFPNVDTLVLCGLESAETLPVMNELSPREMGAGLDALRHSVMQFSFFITKDMRKDLQASRFRGVLPVLLVFMARSGWRVESADAISLAGNGTPVTAGFADGAAPGLLIRCRSPYGGLTRVFYLRQNLADGHLKTDGAFLQFVRAAAPGVAFTKSASYLLHEDSFSTFRGYLLNECSALVQDPSGVPYRFFEPAGWNLRLYGNYRRTLSLFGDKAQQPDLAQAFAEGRHSAQPLPFGIGYLYQPEATCLMVARRR